MADAKGTNSVQLTHLRTSLVDLSWDPDGNSIAVSTTSGKVFLVSLDAQVSRLLFDGVPFTDESVPNIAFSRNGNSLYVLSQPGTGESYELLKVPIAGGTPAKVISGRLTNFAEAMDGRTLFYSRVDGLWKRPVEGGAEQFVASTSGVWDLRGDGLYLLTNSPSIEQYSLDGKRLRTVAKLGHFGVTFPMSISPDARLALLGYELRQTVEIDMLQGFN
jgi:WD40 repeat protein